jgi:hypothetical protein
MNTSLEALSLDCPNLTVGSVAILAPSDKAENVAQTTDGATALSTKAGKGRKTAVGAGNHLLTPDGKLCGCPTKLVEKVADQLK